MAPGGSRIVQPAFQPVLDALTEAVARVYGPLADRLDRLRCRLDELGARRVPYAGAWYWDLKPGFQPGEEIEL